MAISPIRVLVKQNKLGPLAKLAKEITKKTKEKVSEDDLIGAMNRVAKNHRKKKFGYFTEEDIEGEIKALILKHLDSFDYTKGKGPSVVNSFERWFNKVIHNKLFNFHRDKYSSTNETYKNSRMNIMNCLDLNYMLKRGDLDSVCKMNENKLDDIIYDELKEFVESRLSPECYIIYNDCMEDENVSPYYKNKLSTELEKIMEEWGEMHPND